MIKIQALKPDTELTVKTSLEQIAREAAPIERGENFGTPTAELPEGKLHPDPAHAGGARIYIKLNGTLYYWSLST